MKDELGRAEKKKKDSTSAIYKIRVFQFIQNGHNINGEESPCLTAGLSIEDQHENTWTFVSYTTNRPEQPHVVSLAFRSGDRPYGIGAAYFGLHGWQLAIMPVGAVLLGLSIMKD